jgi:uncharacterized protein
LALEFEWDPPKAAANLAKHKVSFEEAATVFGDPLGRIVADPRHSAVEERWVLLGISKGRRLLAVMYSERRRRFALSVPDRPLAAREEPMKKPSSKGPTADRVPADEILPEYDFKQGSPNKFASRYAAGSAVIVLEPDVAAAFSSSGEVNEALRALAGIIQKHRQRRPSSRRSL